MSLLVFTVTSFKRTLLSGNRSFVSLSGTCPQRLERLTIWPSESFSGSLDPNLISGAFGASSLNYDQLCRSLDRMAAGTVALQISYELDQNLYKVTDLSASGSHVRAPAVAADLGRGLSRDAGESEREYPSSELVGFSAQGAEPPEGVTALASPGRVQNGWE